jgi:DNA-binding NarL/FixJ family response regulator
MHIRVLVIDDFPLVRRGLTTSIASDPGIEIVGEASNGLEGTEMALELQPDVVLCDMRMPGAGGMMVLERLAAELPDTRIIVMTASERSETMFQAIAAGAKGYLTKRATQRELIDAVITVHGGGSVVSPQLASELLRDYAATSRGEVSRPRSILTAREQDVLRLMAHGLTDREIGEKLYISPRTVQNQLAAVRRKTGRRRRADLTRWASEHMLA